MFSVVLAVIVFIALFAILGFTSHTEETTDRWGDKREKDVIEWKLCSKQFISLVSLVIVLIGSVKTVPTGFTGIVTNFGRVESYTLDAGPHMMAPWKKVIKMDNRVQKAQVELSCFSSDIQEVLVKYTINYSINKGNAQDLYRNVGIDYYDTIIVPRVQECVKAQFAKYSAESIIADRNLVAADIENDLKVDLEKYNIDLGDTAIEDVDFSDKFTEAAEAKVTAQQDKLTAKTKQETANIEAEAAAERQKIQAQADADAAIIAAQGDAEVAQIAADSAEYQGQKDAAIMSNLGEMLTKYPNLIDYYKATNWDGKLPQTMLGENGAIIDLK